MNKKNLFIITLTILLLGSSVGLFGQTWGPEVQVNSFTAGDQANPVIAVLNDGFIVAWSGAGIDDADGIFGQLFAPNGQKRGGEFRINSEVNNSQINPVVASLGNGFVVAWSSLLQDGSDFGVYAQRFDGNGIKIGGEIRINSTTSYTQDLPSIASYPGGYVIAWRSYANDVTRFDIYLQRFNENGEMIGGEVRANSYRMDDQSNPAVSSINGGFVIVWDSYLQDGYNLGIYGQQFDSAGNHSNTEFPACTSWQYSQSKPKVTSTGDGYVVVWESDMQENNLGVYGQRFNLSGNKLGGEFRFNSYTNSMQANAAIAAVNGGFMALWASAGQDGSSMGIFGQRFNNDGVMQGEEFRVNSYTENSQDKPALASFAGGVLCVWQSSGQDGSGNGIILRKFDSIAASITQTNSSGWFIPNGSWSNSSFVAVSAQGVDSFTNNPITVNESTWQYSINGGVWNNGKIVNISLEGETTVSFKVLELNGDLLTASTNVRIDRTSPIVILSENSNWLKTSPVVITASASDSLSGATTFEHKVGETGSWLSGNSVSISIEGVTQVSFRVLDVAGNIGIGSTYARIDTTPPIITLPTGWTNGVITAQATDVGSAVDTATWECSIDGTNYMPGQTATITTSGANVPVWFRVRDYAGNLAVLAGTVAVDVTPPGISIPTWWTTGSITPVAWGTYSDIDTSTWEYSTDGINFLPGQTATLTENGSDVPIWFRVMDYAGNLASIAGTVMVDNIPPDITFNEEPVNGVIRVTANTTDSLSGIYETKYKLDNGDWQYANELYISDGGSHRIEFEASDMAGNTTSKVLEKEFLQIPPCSTDIQVTPEGSISTPFYLKLDNRFVIIWDYWNSYSNHYAIHGQVLDNQGNKIGTEFTVKDDSSNIYSVIDVEATQQGFIVFFSRGYSGSGIYQELRWQQFNAEGEKIGEEFSIPIDNYGYHLGMLSDRFVLYDESYNEATGYQKISGQVYDFQGNKVGNEIIFSNSTSENQYSPYFAALPQGFVFVWSSFINAEEPIHLNGQIFDLSGNPTGAVITIYDQPNLGIDVVKTMANGFVVFWEKSDENYSDLGAYGRIFDSQGNGVGGEINIGLCPYGFQIESLPDGFICIWESSIRQTLGGECGYENRSQSIQRYDLQGNKIGSTRVINCQTPSAAYPVTLTKYQRGIANLWAGGRNACQGSREINGKIYDAQINPVGSIFRANANTYVYTGIIEPKIYELPIGFAALWGYNYNIFMHLYDNTVFNIVQTDSAAATIASDAWTNNPFVTLSSSLLDSNTGTFLPLDGAITQYSIDFGPWFSGESLTIDGEGYHHVDFRLLDANKRPPIGCTRFGIDLTNPNMVLQQETLENGIRIIANGTDDLSGINETSYSYKIDNGVWQNGKSVLVTLGGTHTVSFRVYDLAGNSGQAETQVEGQPDITPPIITVQSFLTWSNAASETVHATAVDSEINLSGIDQSSWAYQINSIAGDWIPLPDATDSADVTVFQEGETIVYFKVRDMAGNETIESAVVRLDRTPPVFEPWSFISDYVNVNLILTSRGVASDMDSGIEPDLVYTFDGNQLTWSLMCGRCEPVIPVNELSEGSHTLTLKVFDRVGNLTISQPKSFVVDRTAPAITSITGALFGGIAVADGTYAPTASVEIQVVATDLAGAGTPGTIASYSYALSTQYEETPVLDQTIAAGNQFMLNGLQTGMNYLYVQAVDAAGNLGTSIVGKTIKVDTSIPGAPTIESLSHPRATITYDAVAMKDGIFIVKPNSSSDSGILGYAYELKVGINPEIATIVTSGDDADGRIELPGLADNNTNEFYYLVARVRSGSGILGDSSAYCFRIDSTPPQNLKVASETHSNPDTFYNSEKAVFGWNRPFDFTGISTYKYYLSTEPILPQPLPPNYIPPTEWTSTQDEHISKNLADVVCPGHASGCVPAGIVYIAVCAEDYSGNRQFDEIHVRFDIVKPVIPGEISVTGNTQALSARISWPFPTEQQRESGIARSEIKLARINPIDNSSTDITLWIPVFGGGSYQEHLFEALDPDLSTGYVAFVRAIDNAGNETVIYKAFRLDGSQVTFVPGIPFNQNISGYVVHGIFYGAGSPANWAKLDIPENLFFTVGGTPAASVLLTSYEFTNGSFVIGSDNSVTFEASIHGYKVQGTGVSISSAGLALGSIAYTVHVDETTQKTFTYAPVTIGAPPSLLVERALQTGDEFSFQSIKPGTQGASPVELSWLFTHVTTTAFAAKDWILANGGISLANMPQATVIISRREGDGSLTALASLPIADCSITPLGEPGEGDIPTGFVLQNGTTVIDVDKAIVRGDKIIILKGRIITGDGEIGIENLSISSVGFLVKEPDFKFIGDTSLLDILITDNLLSLKYTSFECSLFGFRVTADEAIYLSDRISLSGARIYLPTQFGGGNWPLSGLSITLDKSGVVTEGTGTCSFQVTTETAISGITVTGLSCNQGGLVGSTVSVALPEYLRINGAGTVAVNSLGLASNGNVGNSTQSTSTSFAYTLPNGLHYTFGDTGVSIQAGNLSIDYADFTLTDAYSPSTLRIEGLLFDSTGLSQNGTSADQPNLASDGWTFDISGLSLGNTGIKGKADIQLPYEFGNRTITFNNFTIMPDGSWVSGTVDEAFYIRIAGWLCRVNGLSLAGPDITLTNTTVLLYSIMGSGELMIPGVVIHPDGSFASTQEGTTPVEFLAVNGFKVLAQRYVFGENGVAIAGDIYFPSVLNPPDNPNTVFARFTQKQISLESDGSIVTPKVTDPNPPIAYNVAGIHVNANGIVFDRDGLSIDVNTVHVDNLAGLEFVLPRMQYYPDGDIKIAGQSFGGFEYTLPGTEIRIGISEVRLIDTGLNIKAFVGLPPVFGDNATIYFDKLTIDGNGRITSDVAVKDFGFELGEFKFFFGSIGLDNGNFKIEDASITLPAAMGNKVVRLTHLTINSDGSFDMNGLSVDPFEMWGYIFYLDNISFGQNTVSFVGGVRLPSDFFIPELAGIRVKIDPLSYNFTDGTVEFGASIDEPFDFNLFEGVVLHVAGISLSKEALVITSATLDLPPALHNAGSVSVTNLRIVMSPQPHFSIGSISVNGLNFEYEGLTFNIASLSIVTEGPTADQGIFFVGKVGFPSDFPIQIPGNALDIAKFQIKPDFTIGDISMSVSHINASLFGGILQLSDGTIGFGNTNGITLTCSGTLTTGTDAAFWDPGMRGKSLVLHECGIHASESGFEITEFSADSSPLGFGLAGFQVGNAVISIAKNPATGAIDFGVTGGNGEPAFISINHGEIFPDDPNPDHSKLTITRLIFETDLRNYIVLDKLDAALVLQGDRELFSDISLTRHNNTDSRIAVLYDKTLGVPLHVEVTGALKFGDDFPGIGGTIVDIPTIKFDTSWHLLDLDILATLPADYTVFDTVRVSGGSIHIMDKDSSTLRFAIEGTFYLSPSIQGLPSEITLQPISMDLAFTSAGTIENLNIGTTFSLANIFGIASITNSTIAIHNIGSDELVFDFGGILRFASMGIGLDQFPANLQLSYSTKRGILVCDATLSAQATVHPFTGIDLTFSMLHLGTSGFGVGATLKFTGAMYPNELKQSTFSINNFSMDWNGNITAFSLDITNINVTLAGFAAHIGELKYNNGTNGTDGYIELTSSSLTLPAALGSGSYTLGLARFHKDGTFECSLDVSTLYFDIAGFRLELRNPSVNAANKEIAFAKVIAQLPDFVGGFGLEVNGLVIGVNGIKLTGGKIALPAFDLGALAFRDISVDFVFNGNQYVITGRGSVFIQGLGTVAVGVSFTNVSSTYPIGLKYAEFTYTLSGLGLQLGTTPFFLNQISGGIYFGPPDEMPQSVKWLFGSGMRLKLGVGVSTYGGVVRGNVLFWLDVIDPAIAIQGNVTVMNGLVTGQAIAALSTRGFYGDFTFNITFAQGSIQVWIYPYNNTTKISGAGNIQFGLRTASIARWDVTIGCCDWWCAYLCIRFTICIPPWDIWLPGIGAEFGMFTNGREGIKGFVDVPCWGKVGVFVGSGQFILGNVSEYTLYIPGGGSASATSSGSSRGLAQEPNGLPLGQLSAETRNSGVQSLAMDKMAARKTKDTYTFTIPEKSSMTKKLSEQGAARSAATLSEDQVFSTDATAEVERIIFAVAYLEGDPKLTIISPSVPAHEYHVGDPGVEVMYADKVMYVSVLSSETGTWSLVVDGMYGTESYAVRAFGKSRIPEITVVTPASSGERCNSSFTVRGTADAMSGEPAVVTVYKSKQKNYTGEPIAETVTDGNGAYSVTIPCTTWEDGEYFIFAGVRSIDAEAEPKAYATGSIVVDHGGNPMLPLSNFVAIDDGKRGIDVSFTDTNGERSANYRVFVENITITASPDKMYKAYQVFDTGLLTRVTIPGFGDGHEVRVNVAPIDAAGKEGPRTIPITVTMGSEKQVKNQFDLTPATLSVNVPVNGMTTFDIPFTVLNRERTNTPLDSIEPDYSMPPDIDPESEIFKKYTNISLDYSQKLYDIAAGDGSIRCSVGASEICIPGTYTRTVKFVNRGNNAIFDSVELAINVTSPQVTITSVNPKRLNKTDSVKLEIAGDNFYAGTKLYLDDTELAIEKSSRYSMTAQLDSNILSGLSSGTHTIKVSKQADNFATATFTIFEPTYYILGYKTYGIVPKGGRGSFSYSIKPIDGFTGTAHFAIQGIPQDWLVYADKATVGVEELATLTVIVPQNESDGVRRITLSTQEGYSLYIDVEVAGSIPAPHISSLSTLAAFSGDTISIFGYGFLACLDANCPNPIVKLGDTELTVVSATSDTIVALVPQGAFAGDVTVVRDSLASNAIHLYIKTYGYSILPVANTITMKPGEEKKIDVFVNGYSRAVDLAVTSESGDIVPTISQSRVSPNTKIELTVQANALAQPGAHAVTISGNSEGTLAQARINIVIGEAFVFTHDTLPDGVEETPYYAKLNTINGTSPVVYSLESGDLPFGLTISETGELAGVPRSSGLSVFTIKAIDADQRTVSRACRISISENGWSTNEKSAGASNYSPVSAPSTDVVRWTSSPYNGFTGDPIVGETSTLLKYGQRVIVVRHDRIAGLDTNNGTYMHVFVAGSGNRIVKAEVARNSVVALESNGKLTAIDVNYEGEIWDRSGIGSFAIVDDKILADEAGHTLVLDAATGNLVSTYETPFGATEGSIVFHGNLYKPIGTTLMKFAETGWIATIQAASNITDIAADESGLAFITTGGKLSILNADLAQIVSTETGITNAGLVLEDTRIVAYGGGVIRIMNRETLATITSISNVEGYIAGSKEKLFVLTDDRIMALNIYSGTLIWDFDGTFDDIALAEGRLYALKSDGTVTCFESPENATPPVTTAVIMPATPDGADGWYTTRPVLTLSAHDNETYVEATYYKIGGGEYVPYTAPITLPEGTYSVLWYSTDSQGAREQEQTVYVKVDAITPEVSLTLDGEKEGDTYITPVVITASATDSGSGIWAIEYNLNDAGWFAYHAPFSVENDGTYSVAVRSYDFAGNNATQTAGFVIDTPSPTPDPTAEPTPDPTAEPTETPTAEPTPEPTPDPTPVNTPLPTQIPGTLLGDVNLSGTVDIVDALLVSQYVTGSNPANFYPDNADVNLDWVIDSVDSLLIAQYYTGIIPSLPPPGTTPAPTP